MAKRFTKASINWVELEKRVPKNQKGHYFAFKGKSEGYLRRVLSNPEEPPKINWEEYQKIVPIPGLVDKLKKEYEAFQVPYPPDTQSASVDEQWKSLEGEIKKFCSEMETVIANANKELSRLNALPKLSDMTMEMFYDTYPDLALDPVNRPTFWPHNEEEQPGYLTPEQKAMKEHGH